MASAVNVEGVIREEPKRAIGERYLVPQLIAGTWRGSLLNVGNSRWK